MWGDSRGDAVSHDCEAGGSLPRDGYIVIEDAARPVLEALHGLGATRLGDPEAFMTSARDADPVERMRLDAALKDLLGPVVRSHVLPDAVPFMGAYLIKPPCGDWLPFHQDLTYTDEARHRSYTAWVPLVDVDESNGAVAVVPGSHLWSGGMRAAGPTGSPDLTALQNRFRDHAVTLTMSAGSLLVWDAALVHGSHPNHGDRDRPAAAIAFAASGVELRYFHREGDRPTEGFSIDDRFLEQPRPFSQRPVGYPAAAAWSDLVAEDELIAALDARGNR